jgi:hypothetical protein
MQGGCLPKNSSTIRSYSLTEVRPDSSGPPSQGALARKPSQNQAAGGFHRGVPQLAGQPGLEISKM